MIYCVARGGRVEEARLTRLIIHNSKLSMSKKASISIGIILVVVVAIILITQGSKKDSVPTPVSTSTTSTTGSTQTVGTGTTGQPTESTSSTGTGGGTSGTGTTTTPGTYTLADVQKHNSQGNCWTTINGGVYNVTPWISQHPGGSEAITSLCGIDGSSAFNGQLGTLNA